MEARRLHLWEWSRGIEEDVLGLKEKDKTQHNEEAEASFHPHTPALPAHDSYTSDWG